ncbi:TonB-dependent receptor [Aurantiacibacter flavus]|uniref:TonB-dependent receptor n=1 Tax=Aurantiacibacter flavus TaxID=3145232 RepID=A0ABV0CSG9_9SPHN
MKVTHSLLLSSCVAVLGFAAPVAVKAQDSDAEGVEPTTGLQQIVVTAQKRAQSLQDVPVSVQVVGGDMLQSRSESSVESLKKFDPSIQLDQGSEAASSGLRVRGIGTQSYSRGVEQSVAVVKDGVVAVDTAAALLDFNDVERVEVLRGPQGILFGKNASAGLLNITTKGPTFFNEVGGQVSYGSNNLLQMNGYLSGPVSDNVAVRVAGFRNTMDPLLENGLEGGPGMNDRNDWGVRGKVLFEPTADFSALLTWDHVERENICCATVGVSYVEGGAAETADAPVGLENDLTYLAKVSPNYVNLDSISLELNYETGNGGTITSITAYQNSINNNEYASENDGPAVFFLRNYGTTDMTQFTQELRYTSPKSGPIEFVAGLFYYKRELDRTLNQQLNLRLEQGELPYAFGLGRGRTLASDVSSIAGFGNATFHLSDAVRLSAGLRAQHDTADVDAENFRADEGNFDTLIAPAVGTRYAKRKDDAVSWRVAAEYDVAPDAMIYASVARGYKGLGVNGLATVIASPEPIINPEIPTAYELGWKTEFADRRVRLNGSIYRTEFKDFQAQSIVTNPDTGVASFDLATAGALTTQGFELQLDTQLIDNLSLSGSVSYIDAEYDSFVGAPCYDGQTEAQGCVNNVQNLSGAPLPGISEWNFNVNGRYTVPIDSAGIDAYLMGTYYWRSDFNPSTDPETKTPGHGLADIFLGFKTQDDRFGLQVFVKNLFDTFYTNGYSTNGRSRTGYALEQSLAYDYKRRFGVAASFNF